MSPAIEEASEPKTPRRSYFRFATLRFAVFLVVFFAADFVFDFAFFAMLLS